MIKQIQERLAMSWHVLRGRPLMYRISIVDGSVTISGDQPFTKAIRCTFRQTSKWDAEQGETVPGPVGPAFIAPWPRRAL